MNDVAIRVEHLSKRYQIGGRRRGYDTLRERLPEMARMPVQTLRRLPRQAAPQELWALRDVSFEVKHGEVLGIIGHNGAGKTTMLKILSGITRPTVGRAAIFGRVGSLLEVGTGFHPELTGRENIYLNGAILGMRRHEIQQKFDEIVEFAEVTQFLDTPIKRYSSGMHMRLAFSVAAHLEPDILIVDEVLAVGDTAFQKKCLGKIGSAARAERTVLFVSHNMPAVQSLCDRVLLMDRGRLITEGAPANVVSHYLQMQNKSDPVPLDQRQDRDGDGSVRITSLTIESADEDRIIRSSSRLKLVIGYRSDTLVHHPQFVVSIYDDREIGLFLLHNEFVGGLPATLPQEGSVTCLTEPIHLTAGRCIVHLELLKGNVRADLIHHASYFDVEADDVYGSGMMPTRDWVVFLLDHKWWLNEEPARSTADLSTA